MKREDVTFETLTERIDKARKVAAAAGMTPLEYLRIRLEETAAETLTDDIVHSTVSLSEFERNDIMSDLFSLAGAVIAGMYELYLSDPEVDE